jgi:hypothetical protein
VHGEGGEGEDGGGEGGGVDGKRGRCIVWERVCVGVHILRFFCGCCGGEGRCKAYGGRYVVRVPGIISRWFVVHDGRFGNRGLVHVSLRKINRGMKSMFDIFWSLHWVYMKGGSGVKRKEVG